MFLTAMVVLLLAMAFKGMNKQEKDMLEQKSSFECGFNSMTSTKTLFSNNFIMMVILFLIFDIEVSVMLPMILTGTKTLKESLVPVMFFITLTILLLKEWKTGAMEWS